MIMIRMIILMMMMIIIADMIFFRPRGFVYIAEVSSVSPLSEQIKGLCSNSQLYTKSLEPILSFKHSVYTVFCHLSIYNKA